MAKFSQGFLSGISDFGKMDPSQPQRRLAQAAPQYKQMGTTDPLARRVGSLFGNLGVDTSYMQTGEERAGAAMAEAGKGQFASPEARMIALLKAQLPNLTPQAQMESMRQIGELTTIEQSRVKKAALEEEAIVQERGKQALSKFATARGIDLTTPEAREGFFRIANTYKIPTDEAVDIYDSLAESGDPREDIAIIGNRAFNTRTREFISPEEATQTLPLNQLKDVFTPASIASYVKSGDQNDLVSLAEEGNQEDKLVSSLQVLDNTLETADKALGLTEEYWAGTYPLAQFVPMTAANELKSYVTTLQSNLAFDRLKKMRDNSKTGGALGQVSNIELDLLKSSVSALSPESRNFEEQLRTVKKSYENFKRGLLGQTPVGENYFHDTETDRLFYIDADDNYMDIGAMGVK
jgi:hypothetical protein